MVVLLYNMEAARMPSASKGAERVKVLVRER